MKQTKKKYIIWNGGSIFQNLRNSAIILFYDIFVSIEIWGLKFIRKPVKETCSCWSSLYIAEGQHNWNPKASSGFAAVKCAIKERHIYILPQKALKIHELQVIKLKLQHTLADLQTKNRWNELHLHLDVTEFPMEICLSNKQAVSPCHMFPT